MAEEDKLSKATRSVWAQARRDVKLTQAQLASKLRWKRDRVAHVESGRRRISVADLIQFAAVTKLDAVHLFKRILNW